MSFIDTNVIIDILARDPIWFEWSTNSLSVAVGDGSVIASAVVAAELSRDFETCAALEKTLERLSIVVLPLGTDAAFLSGKAFSAYRARRGGDEPVRVLPDFFIGAHAMVQDMPLITRDPRLYRTYFPDLTLITPETDA